MFSKLTFLTLFTLCFAVPVFAQNAQMQIHTSDGTDSYDLNEVVSMTFVQLEAGDSIQFELGNTGEMIWMVWIPAGTFWMGAQDDETDAWEMELPRHQVTLTEGYWMGKYEVTQAQWLAVTGYDHSTWSGNPNRPAENMSHNQIENGFLGDINTYEINDPWRLPTEAEWEYACRAGSDESWFWWGSTYENFGDYGWYWNNSDAQTQDVGSKLPNPWGLYDMHGNVWEKCSDWLDEDYYDVSPNTDPQGPETGTDRSDKGGSWDREPERARSSCRGGGPPSGRWDFVGFRVVRDGH